MFSADPGNRDGPCELCTHQPWPDRLHVAHSPSTGKQIRSVDLIFAHDLGKEREGLFVCSDFQKIIWNPRIKILHSLWRKMKKALLLQHTTHRQTWYLSPAPTGNVAGVKKWQKHFACVDSFIIYKISLMWTIFFKISLIWTISFENTIFFWNV